MRRAARSAIERSNARRRLSQPPRTRGTRSVQAAATSLAVSRSSSSCSTVSTSFSSHGLHVDAEIPALVRLEGERVGHRVAVEPARTSRRRAACRDLRAGRRSRPGRRSSSCDARRGRRQRLRELGVAEREVVELHGDDVREVGLRLECERRGRGGSVLSLRSVILLLHPRPDEALAGDRDRVPRQAPVRQFRCADRRPPGSARPVPTRGGEASSRRPGARAATGIACRARRTRSSPRRCRRGRRRCRTSILRGS